MNYDQLQWEPSCCGMHRRARFAAGAETIVVQEMHSGMVYVEATKDGNYCADSLVVPGGRAWLSREDARATVAAVPTGAES